MLEMRKPEIQDFGFLVSMGGREKFTMIDWC
jgi:hypothetical protein